MLLFENANFVLNCQSRYVYLHVTQVCIIADMLLVLLWPNHHITMANKPKLSLKNHQWLMDHHHLFQLEVVTTHQLRTCHLLRSQVSLTMCLLVVEYMNLK